MRSSGKAHERECPRRDDFTALGAGLGGRGVGEGGMYMCGRGRGREFGVHEGTGCCGCREQA